MPGKRRGMGGRWKEGPLTTGGASRTNVVDKLIDACASVRGESKGDIKTKELSSPTTRVGRVTSVAKAGSKMGFRFNSIRFDSDALVKISVWSSSALTHF